MCICYRSISDEHSWIGENRWLPCRGICLWGRWCFYFDRWCIGVHRRDHERAAKWPRMAVSDVKECEWRGWAHCDCCWTCWTWRKWAIPHEASSDRRANQQPRNPWTRCYSSSDLYHCCIRWSMMDSDDSSVGQSTPKLDCWWWKALDCWGAAAAAGTANDVARVSKNPWWLSLGHQQLTRMTNSFLLQADAAGLQSAMTHSAVSFARVRISTGRWRLDHQPRVSLDSSNHKDVESRSTFVLIERPITHTHLNKQTRTTDKKGNK